MDEWQRVTQRRDLVSILGRPQTYLEILYLLVAGPLGLGYILLLGMALMLDLLLFGLRFVVLSVLDLLYGSVRRAGWLLRRVWLGALALGLWAVWAGIRMVRGALRTLTTGLAIIRRPYLARELIRRYRYRQRERRLIWRARLRHVVRIASGHVRVGPMRSISLGGAAVQRFKRRTTAARWICLPAVWWRMALFEHALTVHWLKVDLPPLIRSAGALSADGAGRRAVRFPPWLSLLLLIAKAPLGLLASTITIFACALIAIVLNTPIEQLPGVGWLRVVLSGPRWDALLPPVLVVLIGVGAVYVLQMVARHWSRWAAVMLRPDATARRLMEAEARAAREGAKAERAEQRRRELIVNVGHELRTPTANIQGHVESLLLALDDPSVGPTTPATLRTYLGIVQREAERLGMLVDDMLALARAETDQLQLALAPVEAAGVVEEVYHALAPLARRTRQVTVVYEIEPDLPPALVDRQRLVQVLLNLVRNGITYTPAGGIVSITLRGSDSNQLVLSVADTGHGIAPHDLERIFERFYRADQSRTRASGGFGLGLAIVRELVEAMGGSVYVQSAIGEGTCFQVCVPVAHVPAPVGAPVFQRHEVAWHRS